MFVKRSSAGLAGAALASAATTGLCADTPNKARMLAVQGGTPVRSKPYPATWPIFDENEEKALLKVLRSRNWCCLNGNEVYDFEKVFAKAMGAPYCVLANCGTSALHTSLLVLGVGPGDEVITTPRTFIATINVICNCHALPVFIDIDPDTSALNADLIEAAITEHTKAILPVHVSGYPADIEKIIAIGRKHNIPVVEDACQSVFAAVNGKKVGTFGITGSISFQEYKSLVCGEGGAILGSDQDFMLRCASFVNNGRDPLRKSTNDFPNPGSNYRMTEFQAALLAQQFNRFLEQDEIRQRNGLYLEKQLTQIPGIKHRKVYSPNTRITYFSFVLDYQKERFNNVPAEKFAEAVRAEGIPVTGRRVSYRGGCHKTRMLQVHLDSRGYQVAFSKARLQKYRESLRLPVMDNPAPGDKEVLSFAGRTAFVGSQRDMDDIVEAFAKVARNIDKLT
jgi:dTDP-4-amino-4,6-dideoxygalactose transaminase